MPFGVCVVEHSIHILFIWFFNWTEAHYRRYLNEGLPGVKSKCMKARNARLHVIQYKLQINKRNSGIDRLKNSIDGSRMECKPEAKNRCHSSHRISAFFPWSWTLS